MQLAIIGDIHGYDQALRLALEHCRARQVEEIVCIGDLIDGHPGNNQVVELIRGDPAIHCLRGNHDEFDLMDVSSENRDWLRALPDTLHLHGILFRHDSPRLHPETIGNEYMAWNAFDDVAFELAVVGHAHVRSVYRYRDGMGTAAEEVCRGVDRVALDRAYRHLIVNPSLAYNRRGDGRPAFSLLDLDAGTVEFVALGIDPISR